MTSLSRVFIFAMVLGSVMAQSEAPWTQPRDFARFQFLLDRSPFSVPTAEESSPLAERYTLTGAVAVNGESLIFVLDKTTQERHMLSKAPNKLNMGLVEYLPDPDPRRMRATIRVNGQVATISYAEPVAASGQPPGAPQNSGMAPQNPNPSAVVNPPTGQVLANGAIPSIQQQNQSTPQRRVIRRRIISGQAAPGP
ncbi:MAG: hypothetical protein ACOYM3_04315 [Terrimicrobiaceae bacterium]